MKSLLKFLGVVVLFAVWFELINVSFELMNYRDTYVFYSGVLLLSLITTGPIFYFGDNIVIFLKNMKGVFSNQETKDKK
jgi:hypothetical protein